MCVLPFLPLFLSLCLSVFLFLSLRSIRSFCSSLSLFPSVLVSLPVPSPSPFTAAISLVPSKFFSGLRYRSLVLSNLLSRRLSFSLHHAYAPLSLFRGPTGYIFPQRSISSSAFSTPPLFFLFLPLSLSFCLSVSFFFFSTFRSLFSSDQSFSFCRSTCFRFVVSDDDDDDVDVPSPRPRDGKNLFLSQAPLSALIRSFLCPNCILVLSEAV